MTDKQESTEKSSSPSPAPAEDPYNPKPPFNHPTVCSLCGLNMLALCLACQGEFMPLCDYTTGKCQHRFHFHCLARYLRTRTNCPMGGHEWRFRVRGDP